MEVQATSNDQLNKSGLNMAISPITPHSDVIYIYIYTCIFCSTNIKKPAKSRKSTRPQILKSRARDPPDLIQRIRAVINCSLGGRFQNLDLWEDRILLKLGGVYILGGRDYIVLSMVHCFVDFIAS